ncbi:hypothetical protein D5047_19715 [Verminephrobacter eiseniae]|nr:hypothetical protein [Verminephrobacter eiseniae]
MARRAQSIPARQTLRSRPMTGLLPADRVSFSGHAGTDAGALAPPESSACSGKRRVIGQMS